MSVSVSSTLSRRKFLQSVSLTAASAGIVVALLYGPLVLFPITAHSALTRWQLLAASKHGQVWQVETSRRPMKMLPFTAVNQETYSTYLRVA
jgi:hypothetical protein